MYYYGMDMETELRKAIVESELTQYRIAKLADISHASMSQFVNGNRSLSLAAASKLATALGFEFTQKKQTRKARS
jgi:plasmid maintenance system antidote protein VapI